MGRKSLKDKKILKEDTQKNATEDLIDIKSIETTIREKKKKFKFPAARIKRIMQNDDRIGKISTFAPIVLGKATELFLIDFIHEAMRNANGNRKIDVGDFENVIKNGKFAFLENYIKKDK